ncbi:MULTISPECIES: pilus assembly PilX family protein [Thalassolituus]|jgi:Tfp pilus assembly protein PilX|nr:MULTISPECIES: PilX N-terminal domain-containing pilus assembly protein [Thalassolituus]APR66184.1 hypothetical protein CN03_04080 [Thalassolituus oleivorans]MCA6128232.1 hypothetical protein [Thalassolituus oleivorans 4BN06-13]
MQSIHRQQGSALIFSLIILTSITLGVIVSMQNSTLQLRMVNSMQHSQQVFSATYDYLNLGVTYMGKNLNETRNTLGVILQNEDAPSNFVSLASNTAWVTPNMPAAVSSISDQIKLNQLSSDAFVSETYLKGNGGNSTGTQSTYYFDFSATGTDPSGRVASTQQVVFSITGPSL